MLNGRSPYELLYRETPSYSHLKVFGCLCYVHLKLRDKNKFSPRSAKCVFVGYPFGQKGWKVYDLEKKVFLISRDVIFHETEFPMASMHISPSPTSHPVQQEVCSVDEDWEVLPVSTETLSTPMSEDRGSSGDTPLTSVPRETDTSSPSKVLETETVTPVSPPDLTTGSTENLGRGQRTRAPSTRLQDYVMYNARCTQETPLAHSSTPSASSRNGPGKTAFPLDDYVTDLNFSAAHQVFLAAVTAGVEPKRYSEAIKLKVWRDAMKHEVVAHEELGTWDLATLPPGKKAINSKWVNRIKYNADGTIERHKSRLVACGNKQIEGDDYEETFAHVVKMCTVRSLLGLVAAKGWEVHQMDVHNAFLHSDLEEEVYMKLPPGFTHSDPKKVCRLRKAIYGLKQAPRCWYAKLSTALIEFGFAQSYEDYSLFMYIKDTKEARVLVYVDDIVIATNDLGLLDQIKSYLSKCFRMKDLGKLKYFLGIEVVRAAEGIFLSQRKYALDIVADCGLLGAKPVSIPIEQNNYLASDKGPLHSDPKQYRRLVGRLVYLSITRPELCNAIHLLSQFMKAPHVAHWEAALRVVRFLKGSPGQGILLRSDSNLELSVYVDADWSTCPLTRRSLSAFVVLLGGCPISWKTKKQRTMSHSSAEAEYRAMAAATKQMKWIVPLMKDLGLKVDKPVMFYCDSKAAIHIAANPVFHERTKHIERDCHCVRDAVKSRLIATQHVRTKDQIADILTKALGRSQFQFLSFKLSVHDLHSPT